MPDQDGLFTLIVLDTRSGWKIEWVYAQETIDKLKAGRRIHWDPEPPQEEVASA